MTTLLEQGRAVLLSQPFSALLGAELTHFSADSTEIRLPITRALEQQYGFVHGGVLSYLADNALTFAGALSLDGAPVTSEMKINYIRPATGDALVARAHVLSAGRRQAVVRCDVFAVEGGAERLCAAAQGTIAVVEGVMKPAIVAS